MSNVIDKMEWGLGVLQFHRTIHEPPLLFIKHFLPEIYSSSPESKLEVISYKNKTKRDAATFDKMLRAFYLNA